MVQIFYEPTDCSCDGTEYTCADIDSAAEKALSLAAEGRTLAERSRPLSHFSLSAADLCLPLWYAGKDKYPHAYNDYEHFSFAHAHAPYIEFPVLQGTVYAGEAPGADCIVLGSIADDFQSAVYCAVITHDGQRKNSFAECKDDTMNVRGKGGNVPADSERHGHYHGHGGRRLLERLDLD